MTVSLGSITLSEHLILDGLETAPRALRSFGRTLGGRMVVTVGAPLSGGRTLTLQGENHFTYAEIASVKQLEASGEVVALAHHRGTFSVRVIAVETIPAIQYANPGDSDWLSGTITLLEV